MILVSTIAMAVSLAAQPPATALPTPPPPPIRVVPAPPVPPAPLPEPSAAARRLALNMLERIPVFEREAYRSVLNQLRGPLGGNGCDYANPECRRIAEEIATREAPRLVQDMHDTVSRVFGAHFDRTMTEAQIAEATRFFAGDTGGALFASLFALNAQSLAGLEPGFRSLPQRREELAAEFARRTQHLPRAPRPMIPAPPSPPPAPAAAPSR